MASEQRTEPEGAPDECDERYMPIHLGEGCLEVRLRQAPPVIADRVSGACRRTRRGLLREEQIKKKWYRGYELAF